MTTPKESGWREESREQYAERYLRGRLFSIVEHYDKTAVANPPVVREAIDDIIATLVTPAIAATEARVVKEIHDSRDHDSCECDNCQRWYAYYRKALFTNKPE